ncbi:MAG: hypothetical protein ACLVD8_27375 [Enterocloster sp.]|uniref:hypothetical protein n=1 Tax=Enterocloster sp. TaxID=2719315 RepID=UPI00399A8D89
MKVAGSEGNGGCACCSRPVCVHPEYVYRELNYITVNAVDRQIAEVDCERYGPYSDRWVVQAS